MGVNPLEIFEPSLRHWNEDRQRRRLEAHIATADAPPWEADLAAGRIVIEVERPDAAELSGEVDA